MSKVKKNEEVDEVEMAASPDSSESVIVPGAESDHAAKVQTDSRQQKPGKATRNAGPPKGPDDAGPLGQSDMYSQGLHYMADVSQSSHGMNVDLILPPGSQIRQNRAVFNPAYVFGRNVFSYLRSTTCPVPLTFQFLFAGLQNSPLYAGLIQDTSPEIVTMILTESLRAAGPNAREAELTQIISTLSAQHGLAPEAIDRLTALAMTALDEIVAKGNASTIRAFLTKPVGADDLGAALSSPLLIDQSLFQLAFNTFQMAYGQLTSNNSLESVDRTFNVLRAHPVFARLFAIRESQFSVAPKETTPLYALWDKQLRSSNDLGDTALPRITTIRSASAAGEPWPSEPSLFYLDEDNRDQATIDQMKYYIVSNPFDLIEELGRPLEFSDLVQTVIDHDKSVLPIPRVETSVVSLIQYKVAVGGTLFAPAFPYPGANLWNTRTFQAIVGLACTKEMLSTSGNQLSAAVVNLLSNTNIKVTATNTDIRANIQKTMITCLSIIDVMTRMRQTVMSEVLNFENLSLKYTVPVTDGSSPNAQPNPARPAETLIMPLESVRLWLNAYSDMLSHIDQISVPSQDASSLFQGSRIRTSIPLFTALSSTHRESFFVVEKPRVVIEDGLIVLQAHAHSAEGNYGLSNGSSDVIGEPAIITSFDLLKAGTNDIFVKPVLVEAFSPGSRDLDNLIRLIPASVMRQYSRLGAALSAGGGVDLSIYTVVSEMMLRSGTQIYDSMGLASVRASILGFASDEARTIQIDENNMDRVLRHRLQNLSIPLPVLEGTADEPRRLLGFSQASGTLLDTGSSNLVFVFGKSNPLFVEKAAGYTHHHRLPYPLFGYRKDNWFVFLLKPEDLVKPVPEGLKNQVLAKRNVFAHGITYSVTDKRDPASLDEFGANVDTQENFADNVNNFSAGTDDVQIE